MPGFAKGITEQVLQAIQPTKPKEVPEGSRISVHATVSRFAFLYERIRNVVDYKDDHVLRTSAIRRILKRLLILERDPGVIANLLVRELIGARYIPNKEISETVIPRVAVIVRKFQVIRQASVGADSHYEWLRGIIAVEIEDILIDASQEKALVTFLYERMVDHIQVVGAEVSEADLRLQTYIACYRGFVKADDDILGYKLLRAYMPEWLRPDEWVDASQQMAERLIGVQRRIWLSLQHPLAQKFQRTVKPWAVALAFLVEVLKEKPAEAASLLQHPETLTHEVNRVAEKKYGQIRSKLRRGVIRATLYLFATKMLVALLLEIPIEQIWYGDVSTIALVINLVFPPLLMLVVSLLIRIPGKENTARINQNIQAMLSSEGVPMRTIRLAPERTGMARFSFSLMYLVMFMLSFGVIGVMLHALEFTWVSAAIFLFFLCVVSFFAFRLRLNAREMIVVEGRERVSGAIIDFISLPILRAGQWLSKSISRINIFLFFFDFLFEAPFKIFLSVLEEWFAFMKEKKEELQ